jgi:hypothetical protein
MSDYIPSLEKFVCRLCGVYDEKYAIELRNHRNFPWTRRFYFKNKDEDSLRVSARKHADKHGHKPEWPFAFTDSFVTLYSSRGEDAICVIARFCMLQACKSFAYEEFQTQCPMPMTYIDLISFVGMVFGIALYYLKKDRSVAKIIEKQLYPVGSHDVLTVRSEGQKKLKEYQDCMMMALAHNATAIETSEQKAIFILLCDVFIGSHFENSLVYVAPESEPGPSPFKVRRVDDALSDNTGEADLAFDNARQEPT